MNRYYVKEIKDDNVFYCDVTWGVFDSHAEDPEKRHCKDELGNLVVWTYEKLAAEKIAEVMNVDQYIHEAHFNEL